jgi:hypothetical protein
MSEVIQELHEQINSVITKNGKGGITANSLNLVLNDMVDKLGSNSGNNGGGGVGENYTVYLKIADGVNLDTLSSLSGGPEELLSVYQIDETKQDEHRKLFNRLINADNIPPINICTKSQTAAELFGFTADVVGEEYYEALNNVTVNLPWLHYNKSFNGNVGVDKTGVIAQSLLGLDAPTPAVVLAFIEPNLEVLNSFAEAAILFVEMGVFNISEIINFMTNNTGICIVITENETMLLNISTGDLFPSFLRDV